MSFQYSNLFMMAGIALLSLCGCSGKSGPTRYEVSGRVTLNGKPAPLGEIFFQPDVSQGNRGPGSVARIEKGVYKTLDGKGVTVGKHLVNIVAFDGIPNKECLDGNALTTKVYVATITIPEKNSEQHFDVPTSHLVNP